MKQKRFSKGIITLVFLLSVSLFTIFASAATAYAAGTPKLNVKSKAIVKGKDYALKVYNLSETQTVTFTTADEKIASVDETGVVAAVSVGTTIVSAFVEDSESSESVELQCKITVGPPALFIMLSRQEADLTIGQRAIMNWLIAPLNTVELPKFSSSNPEVATVSAGGIVTARSAGTAYIFAQLDNGHFSACRITVTEPEPEPVDVIPEEAVATASLEPEEATESESTFADFLIDLNANFTNGDNTSENTGAESAQ
ncbi:MAG: Ig-like domain-containing protein [Lachnospiraceae bacterium]|nr:Ig-like domain-containing protein [Lachnospiraceae bacterium]MBQ8547953.1 Ig-like domain-containing protein [Lachnospiraceae bacterium]